jgi:hypothetical protein
MPKIKRPENNRENIFSLSDNYVKNNSFLSAETFCSQGFWHTALTTAGAAQG